MYCVGGGEGEREREVKSQPPKPDSDAISGMERFYSRVIQEETTASNSLYLLGLHIYIYILRFPRSLPRLFCPSLLASCSSPSLVLSFPIILILPWPWVLSSLFLLHVPSLFTYIANTILFTRFEPVLALFLYWYLVLFSGISFSVSRIELKPSSLLWLLFDLSLEAVCLEIVYDNWREFSLSGEWTWEEWRLQTDLSSQSFHKGISTIWPLMSFRPSWEMWANL